MLESKGRMLRIMESVAPQWKQMAVALGFSVARIKSIEKGEHYQPDDASFEIFSCWLEGEHGLKPPTWEVLIQCLRQGNFLDQAEMLDNIQIVSYSTMSVLGVWVAKLFSNSQNILCNSQQMCIPIILIQYDCPLFGSRLASSELQV